MRYGMGPEVLRDISFHLRPSSFHFLTGPTGAGKSSLLKLLSLAHRPSRGLITMFDHDIATVPRDELPALRRKIGVVFQDFRLLNHLSALDNVALPLRIAGGVEREIQEHVAELLDWVGLGDRMDARPPTLSGGEKQRVAIARAVIARPHLLIADEPTGSMDSEMGIRLMRLFVELNRVGTTVVVATHDQTLIRQFGNPVMYLEKGELFHSPAQTRRPPPSGDSDTSPASPPIKPLFET
jgi:cell division transport system ATP-binding protein